MTHSSDAGIRKRVQERGGSRKSARTTPRAPNQALPGDSAGPVSHARAIEALRGRDEERPGDLEGLMGPLDRAAAPVLARLRAVLESDPLRQADARLGPQVRLLRRLNALVDKLAFRQADQNPRLMDNYVVWRAKHGPKKHELRLPRNATGTRAWLRARARPHDDHADEKLRILALGHPQLLRSFESFVEACESEPASWQSDLTETSPDLLVVDFRALHEHRAVPGFAFSSMMAACASTGAVAVLWVDARALDLAPGPVDVPADSVVLVDAPSTADRLHHVGLRAKAHVVGPLVDTQPDESFAPPSPSLLLCGQPDGPVSVEGLRKSFPALNVASWGSARPSDDTAPQVALLTSDLRHASGKELEQLGSALARGTVLFSPVQPERALPPPWNAVPCTQVDGEGLAVRITAALQQPHVLHAAGHRSTRFARRHLSREAAFLRFAAHAGVPALIRRPRLVSVLCISNRPQNIRACLDAYRRQTYPHKELVFGANLDHLDDEWVERFIGERADVVLLRTNADHSLGESLNRARAVASGDVWTKFDDDDYYGPRYLEDLVLALESSRAAIVGKGTFYSYVEDRDGLYLTPQAPENQFSARYVHGGTITADRRAVEGIDFLPVRRGTDSLFLQQCKLADLRIYSADRYNFTYIRYKTPGHHTFDVANEDFLRTCRFVARGFDKSLIDA